MKKFTLMLLACPIIAFSQQAANNTTALTTNVQQVAAMKWDNNNLIYRQLPGANLGVTSFEMMGNGKIAFLSDASNEVIIADQTTGNVLNRFALQFVPRDFVYDNGYFYILGENNVYAYSETGNLTATIPYPASYVGVERLARYNNSTYLLLPSGYSARIETDGQNVTPQGYLGWVTQSGNFVYTKLSGNTYSVKVLTTDGKIFDKSFTTDKKVGGVYVVGSTATEVVLDVQTFITESPIQVERHIVTIELNANGLGNITADSKVPDCYYVLSNKEISLMPNGTIMNMVTSPQGAYVFALTQINLDGKAQTYPASLLSTKYHFNDHLIAVDNK